MNKIDVRGYRLLKTKYIDITMLVYFIVFTALNMYFSGTIGLILIPTFCLVAGWQMGCLTERNDWQQWYQRKNNEKN